MRGTGDGLAAAGDARPRPRQRGGFEVASWNGARWVVEGMFDSAAEAATEAKQLLARKHGVRVTEEVWSEVEGVFKSRVVFSEFRPGQQPKTEKRGADTPVAATRRQQLGAMSQQTDTALFISIAALVVSLAALLLTMTR